MAKRSRFPDHIERFRVPIYEYWVYVPFTREEAAELLDWFKVEHDLRCAGFAMTLQHSEAHDVRWLMACFDKPDNPHDLVCTMSHEAIHVAMFLLKMVNVPVDREEHEALAYLQETILSEAMHAYTRWKAKQKRKTKNHGTRRKSRAAAAK